MEADLETREVEHERGKHVEGELDNWIARMDKKRRKEEGERPREVLYAEPCREYALKKDQAKALEWAEWLEATALGVVRTAALIAYEKRQKAAKLRERYGIGNDERKSA